MKIKKGDSVIVRTGKDKGKTGTVSRAFPKLDLVLIDGVNVVKRHQRARRGGQKGQMGQAGQVVSKPAPIHVSNVAIVDPQKSTATRVKIDRENGKRVRVAKKSGAVIGK